MLPSTYIFSAMLCYYCVIIDKTTTLYLGLFYGINPQPYLISSSSIKLIAKPILFCPFLWNKFKLQILVKKVDLIIIREWTKSNCPVLKNLDNFLSATFYLPPPPQPQQYIILTLSMKEIPSHTLFFLFEQYKTPVVPYFSISNSLKPQLFFILAYPIEWNSSSNLFQHFQ